MVAAANEDCVYDGGEGGDGDLEGLLRGKLGVVEGGDAEDNTACECGAESGLVH